MIYINQKTIITYLYGNIFYDKSNSLIIYLNYIIIVNFYELDKIILMTNYLYNQKNSQ